jgi:hypothetical protein
LIESCFGFSLQAVKLQQFFEQSTKGTEIERELGGKKKEEEEERRKKKEEGQVTALEPKRQKKKKVKKRYRDRERVGGKKKEKEGRRKAEKKNQKSKLAEIDIPAEMTRKSPKRPEIHRNGRNDPKHPKILSKVESKLYISFHSGRNERKISY